MDNGEPYDVEVPSAASLSLQGLLLIATHLPVVEAIATEAFFRQRNPKVAESRPTPSKKRPTATELRPIISQHTPPRPPPPRSHWYTSLKAALKEVSSLSDVNLEARGSSILAKNARPDCMPAHPIILSRREMALQWKMRYSTGNVNMPGFQMGQLISVIMGMPIMVLFVTLGSLYKIFKRNTHKKIHSCCLRFRLLFWTGLIYLYHIGDRICGVF